jgi:hypothetical protein
VTLLGENRRTRLRIDGHFCEVFGRTTPWRMRKATQQGGWSCQLRVHYLGAPQIAGALWGKQATATKTDQALPGIQGRAWLLVEPPKGIEPLTYALRVRRSGRLS